MQITVVHRYQTVDGTLHGTYADAVLHDKMLNRHAYITRLQELEREQTADKKKLHTHHWWPLDFVKGEKQKELQRVISARSRQLRGLLRDLESL